jgi:hypothetical protein
MTYLLFGSALSLSAVAAYYSVMGLVAIFASAPIPIFIMGTILEISKLVVASWLYRSWKDVPVLMRSYFTVALTVLMLLTSMGIFGYLSKAHLDQAIPTGDVAAKLSLIDEKIKTEKDNLNANRKELSQLDSQVDSTLSRTTDANGADRAVAIRRGQQKDRTRILKEIGDTQTKIAKYNEERAPIATEVRKVEAEVGPIKYIAALIYGDNPEADVLEKAVRWVIIMIVFVFDPLAVLMLMAASWQMKRDRWLKKHPEEDDVLEDQEFVTDSEVEDLEKKKTEELSKWEKFTDKIHWSDAFFKKTNPLPADAKNIIKDFFQKETPEEEINSSKEPKTVEFDSAGRRVTPLFEKEVKTITIEDEIEGLQTKKT